MSENDTAAPTAHDQMMDAYIGGDAAKAQTLMDRVNVETGIAEPVHSDPTALAPMPPAPTEETTIVARAATTLSQLGPEGAALVQAWGGPTSQNFQENLAYAKSAFKDIATTRPDLIDKFDQSGLGNDPAVLEFLAQHGRLQAGLMGDSTVANRYSSPSAAPAAMRGGGPKAGLRGELAQLLKDNPPGTAKYKDPAVQRRVMQINETLYGTEPAVGQGGRTG